MVQTRANHKEADAEADFFYNPTEYEITRADTDVWIHAQPIQERRDFRHHTPCSPRLLASPPTVKLHRAYSIFLLEEAAEQAEATKPAMRKGNSVTEATTPRNDTVAVEEEGQRTEQTAEAEEEEGFTFWKKPKGTRFIPPKPQVSLEQGLRVVKGP
jgi:hypothetical protein